MAGGEGRPRTGEKLGAPVEVPGCVLVVRLAVNAFAPLRGHVALPGHESITGDTRFEQARSAWARGWPPTLDVVVERDGAPVRLYVESKCVEYLRKHETAFSPAFAEKATEHLNDEAASAFRTVLADRRAFDPLDAPQLLKHFLAAKRAAIETGSHVVVLCVWWVPADAERHDVFAAHAHAAPGLRPLCPTGTSRCSHSATGTCGSTGRVWAIAHSSTTSAACASATT